MSNIPRGKRDTGGRVPMPVDSGTAIDIGDCVFLDTDDVKPAASMTDQATEAANQSRFARLFAGVSEHQSDSGDTDDVLIDASPTREFEFDCASETHEIGDFLALDENAAGDALENQKLVKVTSEADAIFRCVRRDAVASTTVRVVIHRSILWDKAPGLSGQVHIAAMTGDLTLDRHCADILVLDPGAARKVLLPPEAQMKGRKLIIVNTANAAEDITVRDDADGATVCTISQNERGWVVCDGASWYGVTGAQT